MKMTKEQTQKIVLSVLFSIVIIYSYNEYILAPMAKKKITLAKQIADLEPKIIETKGVIAKAKSFEQDVPKAELMIRQVNQMIPDGSPLAWFPTRLGDHFRSVGVERVSTKMGGESPEKDAVGFRRQAWSIEIPKADFMAMAGGIASYENKEVLNEITTLNIEAGLDPIDQQKFSLVVQSLVK